MLYNDFQDIRLSWLGMGNMRLPTDGGGMNSPVNKAEARRIIEYVYENGVNYYDTAFRYHNGESESIVGEVMCQYPRDSYYLATKMPGHMMKYSQGHLRFEGYLSGLKINTPADIFEEQLKKCRVDYFDFYLLHNLSETSYNFYTDEDLKVVDYLLSQKKAGRIRRLGFSTHGSAETIENFLNWNDCFEFVQIQINYLDWSLQEAGKKYEMLTKRGIPIIAMEPCRGGVLASLNEKANMLLKNARPDDSIASWAFRYLQALPNIKVVLSGMTTMEQAAENVKLFSHNDAVTGKEAKLLEQAVEAITRLVPCTSCRYCTEACPQNLDIPKLISMYNKLGYENPFMLGFAINAMKEEERPTACIGCGCCQRLCPQGINISNVMEKFSKRIKDMPNMNMHG